MKDILLIGGGGHCHAVIDVIEQTGNYRIIGVVDQASKVGSSVMDYPVIGSDDDLPRLRESCQHAVITVGQVGSSELRDKLFEQVNELNFICPTIVSPLAYVAKSATVGAGTVLMHHALVNANSVVGKNCIINTKALVEHDAVIEDSCHIATAAIVNGGVRVVKGSFVGSNATSKQAVELKGFIKAGSVAT